MSRYVFDGENRPTGCLADVRANGWDVQKEKQNGKRTREPNDVAVNLLDGNGHHTADEGRINVFGEIKVGGGDAREREVTAIAHHVVL